jgi:hypothetical protein
MTDREKNILIILVPILFFYSISEIKRGYAIIKYNIYTPSFAESVRMKFFRSAYQEPASMEDSNRELTNEQKMSGYYGLVGGIVTLVVITWFIYMAVIS